MNKQTKNLTDLFEEEAKQQKSELPTNKQLTALADFVEEHDVLQSRIEKGEALLSDLKKQRDKILQHSIPEIFKENGNLESLKLTDGRKVTVKPEVTVSIITGQEQRAFEWFEKNNYGAIVKNLISVQTGKGEQDKAEKVKKLLAKAKIDFEDKRGIHSQTLKSTVKTLMEDGKRIPQRIFKIFPYHKTVIK